MSLPIVLAYLLVVNVAASICFGIDKARARRGDRRIPERDLLGLAVIGGTIGAFLGRRIFRHKTRKQPFSTRLMLIAAMQAGGLIGWIVI